MKHNLIFGLIMVLLAGTLFLTSGCSSHHRTRTIFAGDHNVTVTKRHRPKYKMRRKQVHSRRFNRVNR